MDINTEKAFLNKLEAKVRELELDKAKQEQSLKLAEEKLSETHKKLADLGINPEDLMTIIAQKETEATALKTKINEILDKITPVGI